MLFFVKEKDVKRAYNLYLKSENISNKNIISYKKLITSKVIGSDALLPYLVLEYVNEIIQIDTKKNVNKQLVDKKINASEFALYLAQWNLLNCNKVYNLEFAIADTLVRVARNKLLP